MTKEPLGLPRGSVRAMLTLLVVGAVVSLAVLACVGFEPPEYVWTLFASAVTLVLRDYFGSRETAPPAEENDGDIARDE